MRCDLCGGVLVLMGVLGKLTWLRCRMCGHDRKLVDPCSN